MKAFAMALGSRVGSFAFRRCTVGFVFCYFEGLGWVTSRWAGVYVGYVHCITSLFLGHICLSTSHASKQVCMYAVYSFCSRVSITHTQLLPPSLSHTPVAIIYAPNQIQTQPSPTYSQTFENKSSFPPPNAPAGLPPCALFCVAVDAAGAALLQPPKSSSPPHAGLFAGAAAACAVDALEGAAGVLEAQASLPPQASMLP